MRLALLGSLALALAALCVPAASASVSCTHTGPPGNELRVLPFRDPSIDLDFADGDVFRSGDAIQVRTLDAVPCSGPPATLANTETVTIVQSGLSFNGLSLEGGPLWPGGSVEPDGTSETEVRFFSEPGALGYANLLGTAGAEKWSLSQRQGIIGLSFSPDRAHESDVLFEGTGSRVVLARLGEGDDVITASVPSKLARKLLGLFQGGGGNDRVFGSGGRDFVSGGRGDDTVGGGPNKDLVSGGRGNDTLLGGSGTDKLLAHDRARDLVACGRGRDTASVDRGDKVRGCEVVNRG